MKVTITTSDDMVFTLDVSDEIEVENFKALCSMESQIPQNQLQVFFNGNPLVDNKKSLNSYGIKEGDMLLVQGSSTGGARSVLPSIDFSSMVFPNDNTRRYREEADNIFATLQSNPEKLSSLRINNPRLADAFDKGIEEFAKVLQTQQEARAREEQRHLRMLFSDPFDSEAQHMIAEEIRRQQIDSNMETAMEYLPESFGEIAMLYINCRVNGFNLKAFVDSGAQSTIMSKACAEKCNILHLIDHRWSGIAKGVGTQRILGRVHLVQLEIKGDFLPCSFIILEDQHMDMMFGLDMLRRHQCSIDLKANVLRIGTTGTETRFLDEGEIPKFKESRESESDLDKAIRKSLKSSLPSTSSSSTTSTTSQPGI